MTKVSVVLARLLLCTALFRGGGVDSLAEAEAEALWKIGKVVMLQEEEERVRSLFLEWVCGELLRGGAHPLRAAMMRDQSQCVLLMKNGEYNECLRRIRSVEWNTDANICASPQLRCLLFATDVVVSVVENRNVNSNANNNAFENVTNTNHPLTSWNATTTDYFQWITLLWCQLAGSPSIIARTVAFHQLDRLLALLRPTEVTLRSWFVSQVRCFTQLSSILPQITAEAELWPVISDPLQYQLALTTSVSFVQNSFHDTPDETPRPMGFHFPPSSSLLLTLKQVSPPYSLEFWVKLPSLSNTILFNSASQVIRLEVEKDRSCIVVSNDKETIRLDAPLTPCVWHHLLLACDAITMVALLPLSHE